ncbi:ABC transporter permease [Lignipirellula cremea]|uniref:FtsX-like permease family protein n=1 Tax=Lignipirellula cremea TaxID=2528010 RepID=A0A518DW65_9BACT|nr:FtsX-like permease family protein [Lignipirellula cremea]QDU96078.1 FtsX-like permease family protein [Lignipirellula cremea]
MNTLNRKLAREIFNAKGLLLAITSIIAVGVMCFVTLQSAYQNLSYAKRDYYRDSRMADFWIDLKKAPLSEIDALYRIRGVSEIESRISFNATVDLEGVVKPLNGFVLSLPDQRMPILNEIALQQGDYFSSRRANEVIINESFARAHRLYPGQRLHLLMNNRRQELIIVGTALSSEFVYVQGPGSLVPDPSTFGVFYIKRSFAEDVYDFQGAANQIIGRLAPEARDQIDPILQQAETLLDSYGVFSTTPLRLQTSNQFLSNEISGLGAMSTIVPSIFLAVAAVVLNVLLTRLARQQRVVVGTLKALGYSSGQVFWHFLKFGLVVGLIGGLIGAGFGYWGATGITRVYRHFMDFPDLDSRFYPGVMAVGMIVSLGCAGAGAFYGAYTMLRLLPAEAMRPEPPRSGGAIWLERATWFWSLLNASWRMVLRTVFRQYVRSGANVFASMMGAGLLVTGFMLSASQDYLLEFQFYRAVRSDIDLQFKEVEGRPALDEIRRLPGVDRAEPLLNVAFEFVHGPYRRKSAVTGLSPGAVLTIPRDAAGTAMPIPETGLVITRRLATLLHLQQGDQVTLIPVQGERRPCQAAVARIADSYMGLGAYAEIAFLSGLVQEEFALSGAQLLVNHRPHDMRRLYLELKQTPGIQGVTARADTIRNLEKALLENQMVSVITIIVFAGVVFFGSIVSSSMVNLAERRREVATFRALGYTPWQVGGLFFRESMLTNLLGSLLGLPVGYGLVVLTAWSYNNDLLRLPVVTPPWIWFVTLGLATIFALCAQAVVQWSIHRMDFVEGLKVKE